MTRVAIAAVLLWLCCAAAFAQTLPETPLFGVKDFHGDLELRYDFQRDYLNNKPITATTLTINQYFHEITRLNFDGFIYHPRLLTYNAAVGLDLSQGASSIESPTGTERDSLSGFAPEYAISGSLLPKNAVSLDFALSKYTSTLNAPFNPVTTVDEDNQLVTLALKKGPLPAQLAFSHQTSNQRQLGIGENRDAEEGSGRITVNHDVEHSSSALSYEYLRGREDVENVSTVTTRFHSERQVQNASFDNALRLGEANWAALTSRASLRDESGTFPMRQFTENESLVLKHTDHFSTQYGADYSRTAVGPATTELTALQASLTHQLYESLFTYGRVYGSHQNFAGSSEDIEGFALSETYRKRIPWGTLTLDGGGGYAVTDDRTQPGLISIVNESQTLSDAATTFLNNPNVVAGTVVVTNSSGATTFVLDTDYSLIPAGTLTEIRRLPAGAIANGTTVLVRYQFQSGLPVKYGTRDLHGRATLELFNHLTLYANRASLERSALSGADQGQLQNLEETLLGASVRWDPVTVTGEHEIYDSSLTPYTSDRVSLDVSRPVGETQRVGANATYRHVTFDAGGALTLRTVGLTYQAQPRKWPMFNVTAGYEWSNDRGFATEYVYGRIALEYHIRSTVLALEYQANQRNDPTARELSQYGFVSIRRRLF